MRSVCVHIPGHELECGHHVNTMMDGEDGEINTKDLSLVLQPNLALHTSVSSREAEGWIDSWMIDRFVFVFYFKLQIVLIKLTFGRRSNLSRTYRVSSPCD